MYITNPLCLNTPIAHDCFSVHRNMNEITKVNSAWLFFQDVTSEQSFPIQSTALASQSRLQVSGSQHSELTLSYLITQRVGQRHLNIDKSVVMGGGQTKMLWCEDICDFVLDIEWKSLDAEIDLFLNRCLASVEKKQYFTMCCVGHVQQSTGHICQIRTYRGTVPSVW